MAVSQNEREYRALLLRLTELQLATDRRLTELWAVNQLQTQTLRALEEGLRLDRQELARVKAERQEGTTALLGLLSGPKVLPLLSGLLGAALSALLSHLGAT